METFIESVTFITGISSIICLAIFCLNLILYVKKVVKNETNREWNVVLIVMTGLFLLFSTVPTFLL